MSYVSCASLKKKRAESLSGTYIAGDVFDLLHVLLVRSVIRQGVSLSLGLVVLHLVDNLSNNHHHIVRRTSEDTKPRVEVVRHFLT